MENTLFLVESVMRYFYSYGDYKDFIFTGNDVKNLQACTLRNISLDEHMVKQFQK